MISRACEKSSVVAPSGVVLMDHVLKDRVLRLGLIEEA